MGMKEETLYPGGGVAISMGDFIDRGLLWYLNSSALHPRGMALVAHTDDFGLVSLRLVGTGDDTPIVFAESALDLVDERYRSVEVLFAEAKALARPQVAPPLPD